jgi:hypothetical protein
MGFDACFFQNFKEVDRGFQVCFADTFNGQADAVFTRIENAVFAGANFNSTLPFSS